MSPDSRMPLVLQGPIAPVFTAFHPDGSLDLDGQRRLLDFLVRRGGIEAYFVRSGMGQMFTFDRCEAEALIRTACEHLAGTAPVLAGCNGIWDRHPDRRPDGRAFLEDAIHLSRFAEDCGAAGVVHTVPEALTPEKDESHGDLLERFVTAVCGAVSIPVLLYQPPGTEAAYRLTPETLGRVASVPGLAGAKVSDSDGAYVLSLMRAVAGKDFAYIAGDERIWYAALYGGARAVIGQGTILNPKLFSVARARFQAGDREGVLEAQDDINALCAACANPQDFLARYATECGYPVTCCLRTSATNPYHTVREPLSREAYNAFKTMLDAMDVKYG